MLYKNEKRYELTEKDIKDIKDNYLNKNGVLDITWDPRRATVSPTKALSPAGKYMNREQISEFPPSFQIPTKAVVENNGNKDEWIYTETTSYDQRTQTTRYLPKVIGMTNSLPVTDMELAFFLVNCSPFVGNGKVGLKLQETQSGYTPDLRIVVKDVEAKAHLENEEAQDDARITIRKEGAIEDIRKIAASYGIPGSSDMEEAVLRKALLDVVKYDPQNPDPFVHFKTFLKKFKEMSKEDEISADVQILLDENVIKFDSKSNTWFELKADGSNGAKIITLKANQSKNAVGNLKAAAENQAKIGKLIKDLALSVAESKDK